LNVEQLVGVALGTVVIEAAKFVYNSITRRRKALPKERAPPAALPPAKKPARRGSRSRRKA
jgi:hypothetical protein